MSYFHVTTFDSFQSILQDQEIRPLIGPRSSQASEPTPLVFAFSDYEALEDANWLWEQFEDDESLVIIEIDDSAEFPLTASSGLYSFEVASIQPVRSSFFIGYHCPDTGEFFDSGDEDAVLSFFQARVLARKAEVGTPFVHGEDVNPK